MARTTISRTPHHVIAEHVETSYLGASFDPDRRQRALRNIITGLTPYSGQFEAIAVRGLSGTIMGTLVSHFMSKGLIVVRKAGEMGHGMSVEGASRFTRYIILDDFVCSGSTIQAIIDAIRGRTCNQKAAPVACYFYGDQSSAQALWRNGHLYPVWSEPDEAVPVPIYPPYVGTISSDDVAQVVQSPTMTDADARAYILERNSYYRDVEQRLQDINDEFGPLMKLEAE